MHWIYCLMKCMSSRRFQCETVKCTLIYVSCCTDCWTRCRVVDHGVLLVSSLPAYCLVDIVLILTFLVSIIRRLLIREYSSRSLGIPISIDALVVFVRAYVRVWVYVNRYTLYEYISTRNYNDEIFQDTRMVSLACFN